MCHLQTFGGTNTLGAFGNIVTILPFVFSILFSIFCMQEKPRGTFKTERKTVGPNSIAVREIPTLALTFTTEATETTGRQMRTDVPPE